MATKKIPRLSESLKEINEPREMPSLPKVAKATVKKPASESKPVTNPGRTGHRVISAYFSEETHKQFKILGVEQGSNNQEMLREALNDLFKKYGKPPLA